GARTMARRVTIVLLLLALVVSAAGATAQARTRVKRIGIGEYSLPAATLDRLRTDWVDQLLARYPEHTWAPMRFDLSNADLRLMGLPPKRILLSHRYRVPTAVYPNGKMVPLASSKPRRSGRKPSGGSQSTSSPGLI